MVYYRANGYNSGMFLVGILSWWYNDGLRGRFRLIKERFASTSDFFSIGLLFTTLFAPYRQISAGGADSLALSDRLRAMADKLISRTIGGFIRIFMIIFGTITIILQILFGVLVMVFWLFIPLIPIIGLIITVLEWTP